MFREYLLLVISFIFLGMQAVSLGYTMYLNHNIEQHTETVTEKTIIIEHRYIETIQKYPEDIIEESEEEIFEEIEEKVLPTLVLSERLGRVQGPQEEETWYNLPMDAVIRKMRELGYSDNDYPYYVTDNGIKMLGDFIMVAADTSKYPKGTVVQTSLGQGMVCDKHETDSDVIDIAVDW